MADEAPHVPSGALGKSSETWPQGVYVAGDAECLGPEPAGWLVRNYGPRCTLVCAASALGRLGARPGHLVEILEAATSFNERYGPSAIAYLGGHSRLDRGIECAARQGGLEVSSRTRFLLRWADVRDTFSRGGSVILNCYRAPSRQWNHSVLATASEEAPRRLLTLDPNDGRFRWLTWRRPATGWVCTATFIQPLPDITNPASSMASCSKG